MTVLRFRKRHAEIIDALTFNSLTADQQKAELQRMEAELRKQAKANGCDTADLDAELDAVDEDVAATLAGIEIAAKRLKDSR